MTLRARWVTLRARWVTLRARWVTLRARWVKRLPASTPRPSSARAPPKRAPTNFSVLFDRGDLRVQWSHEGATNGIKWSDGNQPSQLTDDGLLYLVPIYFEGLREVRTGMAEGSLGPWPRESLECSANAKLGSHER
jgi:hypothetical protein